jgi:hypothetical protein
MRYAFFPASRRLAVETAGRLRVYDTADHRLTGFAQQQSGGQSLAFTGQHGEVRVADLAEVPADAAAQAPERQTPAPKDAPANPRPPAAPASAPVVAGDDVFAKIERLADLHARGILTDGEFEAKKTELLARI